MIRRTASAFTFAVALLLVLSLAPRSFSGPVDPQAIGPIQRAKLISPSHGWALAGGRLLWTENDGVQWNDITPELGAGERIASHITLPSSETSIMASSQPHSRYLRRCSKRTRSRSSL